MMGSINSSQPMSLGGMWSVWPNDQEDTPFVVLSASVVAEHGDTRLVRQECQTPAQAIDNETFVRHIFERNGITKDAMGKPYGFWERVCGEDIDKWLIALVTPTGEVAHA